jgi:sulfur carrier protein
MRISLKLFASLREYGPAYQEIDIPENAVLRDVIKTLGIPDDDPLIKIVNGIFRDLDQNLEEGDVVALFPPIGGG